MASFIQGYEYDIISCRLKDTQNNKGDHWIMEFANSLSPEHESNLKEARQ